MSPSAPVQTRVTTAPPRAPSYGAMAAWAIAALTAARLLWLAFQTAGLYPDEAQYWFWSRHLALGYYSKPPLVAWLIALTTGLFGNGEFAVRLSAPLLHAAASGFVYGAFASAALRPPRRVLGGARLRDAARRFAVGLPDLDRRGAAAVLGGGALRVHPGARGP